MPYPHHGRAHHQLVERAIIRAELVKKINEKPKVLSGKVKLK
jgi:hypothetical protein